MIPVGYRISNTPSSSATTTISTNTVLSVFKMMNILNDSHIAFLQALFQDSVATILAIAFIFTPTFIANYGMITIALLLPAIRTASCCVPSKEMTDNLNNHKSTIMTTTAGVDAVIQLQWLHYWICISTLWVLRIYAFKFWPSYLILLSLWLQHSYFLGATFIFNYTYQTILFCIHRNEKIQQEKAQLLQENENTSVGDDDLNQSNNADDNDVTTMIEGESIDHRLIMFMMVIMVVMKNLLLASIINNYICIPQ